jgi:tripartite-type tricarboxylate transporter receptor subunit TctC
MRKTDLAPFDQRAGAERLLIRSQPTQGKNMAIATRFLTAALLIASAAAAVFATDNANYPARPIRIVLGFAAGGAPDTLARIIGEHLTASWRQPVVVENRTGAGGNIAMTTVANAPPDGYTLALVPNGNATVSPSLFADLPYNLAQFAPISQIANVENVLVTSGKSPVKSLAELIALGRTKGANLTYATPGAGSTAHLAAELLARNAGIEMRHITYRGVTPALTDVLRGEVTVMFSQLSTAKPLIDSGDLRALGIASRRRSAALPEVPTIADAGGMPGFEAVSWYALMAPAGTPESIIVKLRDGIVEAINAPAVKAALEAQGARPIGGTPAELAAVIAADTARWAKLIQDANIKVTP